MWRVKVRISNSLSARCASACPLRHTCTREEKHREWRAKNKHATFVRKGGRFSSEAEENRKKVHNFSHASPPSHFSTHFLSIKSCLFERKLLSLHLTKHNPPFFSPHCGVYIARKAGRLPYLNANDLWLIDQRLSCHLPNIPWCIQHLAASNRHTVSQSVQPWSFPFISTTLCDKCSKRNSYFCPK